MTALDVLVDRVRDGKDAHVPEAMAVALRRRLTETERSRLTVDHSPVSRWVFVSLWPAERVVLTDEQGFTVRADSLGRTADFGPAGDRLTEWG